MRVRFRTVVKVVDVIVEMTVTRQEHRNDNQQ